MPKHLREMLKMKGENKMNPPNLIGAALLAVGLAGCATSPLAPDVMPTGQDLSPKFTGPKSDAGIAVPENTDATQFPKLVSMNSRRFGGGRRDPFALTSSEKLFDKEQEAERLYAQAGPFAPQFVQVSEVPPPVYVEPQPYRRLAGVVVGDSVLAIIEMGNGSAPVLIHPGMKIPNSPWTVVSIDQDKAILRRDGNTLPKEISVRLEVAPANMGGGSFNNGAAQGNSGGGFPGAGRGGPPPGFGGGKNGGGNSLAGD